MVGAVVHAVVQLAHAPRWTVDDAYIVARYAEHAARAGRFAYNLSEPPVEGFTSPLFAAIATLAALLGRSPITAMTACGLVAYVASGPIVYALGRELRLSPVGAGVAAWLYLAVPEHLTHAMSGLETEAFLAIELACALAFARAFVRPSHSRVRVVIGLALLVCLTRPEGLAVAGALLAALALRSTGQGRRHLLRASGLGLGLPLLAALALRVTWFHALLPNTFYAKTRGPIGTTIAREALALADDYVIDGVVVSLAAVAIGRLLGVPLGRLGSRSRAILGVSAALLLAFGATYARGDVMNYSRRFALHAFPWVALVALVVLGWGAKQHARLRRRRGPVVTWGMAALGAAMVAVLYVPRRAFVLDGELGAMGEHLVVQRDWYRPAVAMVNERVDRSATIAVVPDAGFLPFYTDRFTVDFGRLNDRYLAREAKTSDDVVRYFFDRAPDAVVISHYGPEKLFNEAASRILSDARFEAGYERVGEWRDARRWGISLYVKRLRR
ncbi:MAG: hypothetical protein JST00_39880 [Deltaproteobacteria bacterium]|nr:hypothetical protein [Deltaproteobacteria bacterium]